MRADKASCNPSSHSHTLQLTLQRILRIKSETWCIHCYCCVFNHSEIPHCIVLYRSVLYNTGHAAAVINFWQVVMLTCSGINKQLRLPGPKNLSANCQYRPLKKLSLAQSSGAETAERIQMFWEKKKRFTTGDAECISGIRETDFYEAIMAFWKSQHAGILFFTVIKPGEGETGILVKNQGSLVVPLRSERMSGSGHGRTSV